ncbi:hypothetical protein FI667_g5316, partial [Globisporangium splendens]
MLLQAAQLNDGGELKLKRCVQCFQDLEKDAFSKRQYHLLDGKCIACVTELERAAAGATSHTVGKWSYDQHYRTCHRGKTGGVAVRIKCNIASPILGFIPLGRVFCATAVIYNEQGDPMVKLESLSCVEGISEENQSKSRDGWVPCRSIRNEVMVEPHSGPFNRSKYYRCVIEGCKARVAPDLELPEIGYVLYGDVVEVVEAQVSSDGVMFLQLHKRYFDESAWVVERTLDNESVLNEIEGPSQECATYRCVQESGAPTRLEPSLASPPIGRIACGTVVTVVERVVTPERQVFLKVDPSSLPQGQRAQQHRKNKDDDSETLAPAAVWVIETSTCCASVMVKLQAPFSP